MIKIFKVVRTIVDIYLSYTESHFSEKQRYYLKCIVISTNVKCLLERLRLKTLTMLLKKREESINFRDQLYCSCIQSFNIRLLFKKLSVRTISSKKINGTCKGYVPL